MKKKGKVEGWGKTRVSITKMYQTGSSGEHFRGERTSGKL